MTVSHNHHEYKFMPRLANHMSMLNSMLPLRAMLLIGGIAIIGLVFPSTGNADLEAYPIGTPLFEPVGLTFGPAKLSGSPTTAEDFFELSNTWASEALGDHHLLTDDPTAFITLPGEPHVGPYDNELKHAFTANGLVQTDVLSPAEFGGRNFYQTGFVLVPSERAPLGDSPDGASVPVIPDDIYPLRVDWIRWERNGEPVDGTDPNLDLYSLASLNGEIDETGNESDFAGLQHSHQIFYSPSGVGASSSISSRVGEWVEEYEILDNSGKNGWRIVSTYEVVARSSRINGDLNHDGDLDIHDLDILNQNVAVDAINLKLDMTEDRSVDVGDVHFWVTDLKNTWIGDANLDGEFNSGDFVQVFSAGKYETDELATWSEGDWNADERFDSGDFVVAFSDGGYEKGARATAAVPEPSGCLLLMLGMCGIIRWRKKQPRKIF